MSASQPLSLVTDYGELSSANATSAVITVDHTDSKIQVGDYVTLTGAAVGAWNTLIAHVEVTAKSAPQQWNDYKQTITVNANSSALADFTGTATLSKSVIFRLAPETASGCTLHLNEVGVG